MPARKRPAKRAAKRAPAARKRPTTKRVAKKAPVAKVATPVATKAATKALTKKRAATAALADVAAGIGEARTIVYVHGIGNKPIPSILKSQWDHALFGYDLGERSRMAYWVNRDYYPVPDSGAGGGDLVELEDRPTGRGLSVRELLATVSMADEVAEIGDTEAERRVLARIGAKMEADALARHARHADAVAHGGRWQVRGMDAWGEDEIATAIRAGGVGVAAVGARVLPIPAVLRQWITRKLTRAFLRDVHDYFFVEARRERMRESLRERLRAGGGPFAVVAHSQGSMIAYDVLSSPEFRGLDVRLLVTLGSPLGLEEAQDNLRKFTGQSRLRVPPGVVRWVNVADPLDPVALDKSLKGDYGANATGVGVEDKLQWNADGIRNPHSGTGYLRTPPVQRSVRDTVQRELFQPVSDFIIARDVVRGFENAGHRMRQPVLIELAEPAAASGRTLLDTRAEVIERILAVARETEARERIARGEAVRAAGSLTDAVTEAQASPPSPSDDEALHELLRLESLRRFVAADLTREEAERLAASGPGLTTSVRRVWRNAQKRALGATALQTVQALPAHLGYRAMGEGITWAVLDTGVTPTHPHFASRGTVEARYDCTRRRALPSLDEARTMAPDDETGLDDNGHGTHVAGIIAGAFEVTDASDEAGERKLAMSGVAPRAKLHSYRVLNRDGDGEDAWIIKALDHVAETNERAGKLVIHGVNLSLGGSFDQSTFGCGHTPLCRELRRLWQQGVLVVLAAGNEGFQVLRTIDGTIDANMDLSIGDPANLEEAIAVGSVHTASPHTYGVSYFSSRGPTADGRQKPDVVAPGERVVSCRHRFARSATTDRQLYVEMSGTSMAAPYVSGLLAAYLSVRQEFIGYPDRVKQLLLDQATDLKRDRFLQGAGLPNLMRMLMAT